MKNVDKKVIIILVTMLIASLVFTASAFNKPLYQFVYWGAFCVTSIWMLGKQKDRTMYKIDFIQVTFIYVLGHLILMYLGGLIFGFSRVPYSLEPVKILKNILMPVSLIIVQEVLRFCLIKERGQYKSIFITLALSFSFIEIFLNYRAFDFKSAIGIFDFIGNLVIPSITKNLLLTYLTSNCGMFPSIIYRLLMELYVYFVPIVPDYGIYINSIMHITLPTIVYLKFNSFLSKQQYQAKKDKNRFRFLLYSPVMIILVAAVLLVSGMFKYSALAIGSGSMRSAIQVGDVVIIEKMEEEELLTIEKGDILVYVHDSKIIVHRVTKVRNIFGETIFRTKGDNNPVEDDYNIPAIDVIGVVRFKIPFIGYPSVWLSEKLS